MSKAGFTVVGGPGGNRNVPTYDNPKYKLIYGDFNETNVAVKSVAFP
jgi:hypothetical protein